MGCCVSSNKSTPPPHSTKSGGEPPPLPPRSPPPPHPLEETVKEVLSETAKPKPTIPKILEEPKKTTPLLANIQEEDEKHETQFRKKPKMVNFEEISEVSEIYSTLSESISTNTERRDNEEDGEVRQRVHNMPEKYKRGSFSGDFSARKERGVVKSPARSEPSPGRVRTVPGRDRRGVIAEGKVHRDPGEISRRRSKTPVVHADGGVSRQNLGRSPSVRKTGKSPGRVGSDLAEKTRKMGVGGNIEGKWPPTSTELLENPLVSLECFIFL